MSQKQSIQIQFPVGRLIMGDVYKGSDKDQKGQPRLVKSGPNKGQAFTQFFIGVAIPKNPGEAHWSQTAWGQQILQIGAAAFPNFYQNPAFAWKIEDGDSTVPNKSNRRMCDSEGAPGHWVIKFSSGFAPKVYTQPTPGNFVEQAQPGLVKTGYWVQVFGNVAGNGSSESPGVYVGHNMLLFVRSDAEISMGPSASDAFAGAAVSQALPGGSALPGMPAAAPALPALALPVVQAAVAPALPAAPLAVAPNASFLAVPGAPAAAALPALAHAASVPMAPAVPLAPPLPPAAPAGPVLTPAGQATGFTYEAFVKAGWNDAQLRANGYLA